MPVSFHSSGPPALRPATIKAAALGLENCTSVAIAPTRCRSGQNEIHVRCPVPLQTRSPSRRRTPHLQIWTCYRGLRYLADRDRDQIRSVAAQVAVARGICSTCSKGAVRAENLLSRLRDVRWCRAGQGSLARGWGPHCSSEGGSTLLIQAPGGRCCGGRRSWCSVTWLRLSYYTKH